MQFNPLENFNLKFNFVLFLSLLKSELRLRDVYCRGSISAASLQLLRMS